GLDVVEAGDLELAREVVPFLVIAGDDLAADRETLLEPPAQPLEQGVSLILLRLQEVEELALAVQVGEGRATEDAHQLVAVQRFVDAILEVALAGREVVRVRRVHALQAGEDVPGDLDGVERFCPEVWIAEDVNVA